MFDVLVDPEAACRVMDCVRTLQYRISFRRPSFYVFVTNVGVRA